MHNFNFIHLPYCSIYFFTNYIFLLEMGKTWLYEEKVCSSVNVALVSAKCDNKKKEFSSLLNIFSLPRVPFLPRASHMSVEDGPSP